MENLRVLDDYPPILDHDYIRNFKNMFDKIRNALEPEMEGTRRSPAEIHDEVRSHLERFEDENPDISGALRPFVPFETPRWYFRIWMSPRSVACRSKNAFISAKEVGSAIDAPCHAAT